MDVMQKNITDYLRGSSSKGYEVFGAHLAYENNQHGTRFTVYAPHARQVQLIGNFNGWNNEQCMDRLEDRLGSTVSGVWSTFIADVGEGEMYKYRVTTQAGEIFDRADPFAFYSQCRPETASIVFRLEDYYWKDQDWMSHRKKLYDQPMNIYEVHVGSWKTKKILADAPEDQRFYHYMELAEQLIAYVKEMNYTHIELMPLTEYPFDGSWGYQVTGYFSATSRYGDPRLLMNLIDRCHQEGIGVFLDFVPAHFVRDFYALHLYDGSCLYEIDDEDQRYTEWGTAYFDFTKPHVCNFVHSSLNFWLDRFHFDGIRYDAVSNLIYEKGHHNGAMNYPGIWFLKSTNYALQLAHPDVVLIAEDSTQFEKVTAPVVYGGLGFDYKWNMGWMHDTLRYLAMPFPHREYHREGFLFSMSYFYRDIFILSLSHDEVVHGKKTIIDKIYGNYSEKFSQLRCLYLYMFAHPGKKLNFMGNELGEFREWNENTELSWNLTAYPAHRDFQYFFKSLQKLYLQEPALFQMDYNCCHFKWLNLQNTNKDVFAMERVSASGERIYTVLNFSDQPCTGCIMEVAVPGVYTSLLQTDASEYGGEGRLFKQDVALHSTVGKSASFSQSFTTNTVSNNQFTLKIDLPPLSGCMLKAPTV